MDKKTQDYYPFYEARLPSFFEWLVAYIMMPYAFFVAIKEYESRKPDRNCISNSKRYMKGITHAENCTVISVKKAKEASKKMGVSFNELVLGMTSKALK